MRWLGKLKTKDKLWNDRQINQISISLIQTNHTRPHEIHRSIRSLRHVHYWKATEFRTLLLYNGIVTLKFFLPANEYQLFLKLVCAVRICSSKVYVQFLPLAHQLFIEYIEGYIDIYGIDNVTSNVHYLSHVVDDVQQLGDLSTISTYDFENTLHHIKLLIKQCNKPLEQISRRLHEQFLQQKPFCFDEVDSFPKLSQQFRDDNAIGQVNICFRQIEYKANVILNNNIKDKWFLTKNGVVVQFEFVFKAASEYIIRGQALRCTDNFFTNPFDSKYLDIHISDGDCSTSQNYDLKSIKCKLFCVSCEEKYVFIPLLHTL